MQAAVVEGAGRLVVRDLPEPAMGEYEARCAMLFGAVCAGTDTHLVEGHAPFCHWVTLPFILGHESVGRVTAVGAQVRNLKVGDVITRVGCPPVGDVSIGWGGFAQVGIATDWRAMQEDRLDGWDGKTVQQVLPAVIDPAVGTLFITWRETLSFLTRLGVPAGASVLVIGSGGNGLAFTAHARNLGAARVTLVGAANRAADGARAGATTYLDYRRDDCWAAATAEGQFDIVIDAVGKAAMTAAGQRCLRPGGTIAIYGMDEAGAITLTPGATFTYYGGGYDEAEAHDAVLRFYRAGKLNPAVWFDRAHAVPLADIGAALDAIRTRTAVKPLVVLS
jgi:D-arabinose 1-dehydrogenase-like Zn-dependent alcohol dehydrogenase